MRSLTSGLTVALLLLTLLAAWTARGFPFPAALGIDAPPSTFSAGRAFERLADLLGDESPHPVGSEANRQVRDRIVAQLNAIGIAHEVQRGTGCHRFLLCAHVENVMAEIPGTGDGAILLMAHYDSVPAAPGAGDNGAAVAVLLEVARMLADEGPFENAIRFLFTDGEEYGLLGADLFFTRHRWAEQPLTVLNLEGSGSGGPVYLLRTGRDSGHLVQAYLDSASYPVAHSIAQAIFELMPNDTDFSVAAQAGHAGIDFAFADRRHTYHTPLDRIDNLDRRTVQHHGMNAIELTRALANRDLQARHANFVFHSFHVGGWVRWPSAWSLPIALAALTLLLAAALRLHRDVGAGNIAFGAGAAVIVIAMSLAASLGGLALVDALAGARPPWPANPWPWRLVLFAAPLFALCIAAWSLPRRVGFWPLALGTWLIWSFAAVLVSWQLPQASAIVLAPAVIAACALAALGLTPLRNVAFIRPFVAISLLVVAALFLLPLAWAAEAAQSLLAANVSIGVPLALLAATLAPLLPPGAMTRRRHTAPLWLAGGTLTGAAIVLAPFAVLYTPAQPQWLMLRYVQDLDEDRAYVIAMSPDPVPDRLAAPMQLTDERRQLPGEDRGFPAAPAVMLDTDGPWITNLEQQHHYPDGEGLRTLSFRLHGTRDAHVLSVAVPDAAGLVSASIDGRELPPRRPAGTAYFRLDFVAPPPDGVAITLTVTTAAALEVTLAEMRLIWPPALLHLVEARGALGTTFQFGDHWLVLQRAMLQ